MKALVMDFVYFWLLFAGITFLVELGHPGLFLFLSISIGSLVTAMIAMISDVVSIQLICFICTSIVSFYSLKHFVSQHKSSYASNAHALIGADGYVTEKITHQNTGRVRVRSEEWIARSLNGTSLEVGSRIHVIRIERTTLIVMPHNHI